MIRPFDIQDFVARFHRNGNAQSFYACAFTYKGHKLRAVLFGGREIMTMTHGYCAVLSNDIDQCWRGEDFEPTIHVLIDKLGDEVFSGDGDTAGKDQ